MGLVLRHRLAAAIVGLAVVGTGSFFVFDRPRYEPPHQGSTIRIPDGEPAQAAAGRAGWVWPSLPGWEPGRMIKDYPVSGIQAIEVEPARLAAAHFQLDADQVRVLTAEHFLPGEPPLMILAAPQAFSTPAATCLAAVAGDGPVIWRCPGSSRPAPDVAHSHALVAATAYQESASTDRFFWFVGVARGDVTKIILHIPNQTRLTDSTLYTRGETWGQFSAADDIAPGAGTPELRIYGRRGLVQTVRLDVESGEQRSFG